MAKVTHDLKTHPEYFQAIHDGIKQFEVRKDDRGFRVGDALHLREYLPHTGAYTGRELWAEVTYILDDESVFGKLALQMNYVVMSIALQDELPF